MQLGNRNRILKHSAYTRYREIAVMYQKILHPGTTEWGGKMPVATVNSDYTGMRKAQGIVRETTVS